MSPDAGRDPARPAAGRPEGWTAPNRSPRRRGRFRPDRRRYDPYDDYDPYDPYDPRNRGWGGPRRYYGPAPGGSCLRDACLIETGCCIGESLDGNCLVLTLLAGPQLAAVLLHGARAGRAHRRRPARRGGPRLPARGQRPTAPGLPVHAVSCSAYAVTAIQTHGARRGALLALRRIVRCRPGVRRGPDPVPPA